MRQNLQIRPKPGRPSRVHWRRPCWGGHALPHGCPHQNPPETDALEGQLESKQQSTTSDVIATHACQFLDEIKAAAERQFPSSAMVPSIDSKAKLWPTPPCPGCNRTARAHGLMPDSSPALL